MPEAKNVNELGPSWKQGAYVRSETDYYEEEKEEDQDLSFAWFAVRSNQQETPEEVEERKKAIEYQIRNGILQTNGLPAGMKLPEPSGPSKPKGKFARKAMRQQQREMDKRKRKLQQQMPLAPSMRNILDKR